MSPVLQFLRYWWLAFESALSETFCESRPTVSALGGAVIAPLIALATKFSKPDAVREMVVIALLGGVVGVIIEFLLRLLYMPAKMHAELTLKNQQLSSVVASHNANVDLKDKLSNYYVKLGDRIQEIRKLGATTYVTKYMDAKRDTDSLQLVEEITEFLKKNVGHDRAALFNSTTGLKYHEKAAHRTSPPLSITSEKAHLGMGVIFTQPDWYAAIDELTYYAAQLKEIIQELD